MKGRKIERSNLVARAVMDPHCMRDRKIQGSDLVARAARGPKCTRVAKSKGGIARQGGHSPKVHEGS